MSLDSILRERFAHWGDALLDMGYVEIEQILVGLRPEAGAWGVRARRSPLMGPPEFAVKIEEVWRDGPDPLGLTQEEHGCHLSLASWHAQIQPDEEKGDGAERFEVHRKKPPEWIVHRHPFGRENNVREQEPAVPDTIAWLIHVEQIVAEL